MAELYSALVNRPIYAWVRLENGTSVPIQQSTKITACRDGQSSDTQSMYLARLGWGSWSYRSHIRLDAPVDT